MEHNVADTSAKPPDGLHLRIRQSIRAAKHTQGTIAGRLGKSRAAVAQWGLGRSVPSVSDLLKLAATCGVRSEWLICGSGPMYEPGREPRNVEVVDPLSAMPSRIAAAMCASGETDAAVAAATGKRIAMVTAWRAADRAPSLETVVVLSRLFGVRLEWLVCGTEPMYEPGREPPPTREPSVPAIAHDAVARLAADPPPRADLPAAPYAPGGAEDGDDAPRELTIVRDSEEPS